MLELGNMGSDAKAVGIQDLSAASKGIVVPRCWPARLPVKLKHLCEQPADYLHKVNEEIGRRRQQQIRAFRLNP